MTVAGLIKILKNFPKNRQVVINNGEGMGQDIAFVESVRLDSTDNMLFEDDGSSTEGIRTRGAVSIVVE